MWHKYWLLVLIISSNAYSEIRDCKVSFETTATPGALAISGKGGRCEGMLTEKKGLFTGSFKSKIELYDTGIKLRNKHMYSYLGAIQKKYMELTFKDQKDDGQIDAILSIKNDTRPVVVIYKKNGEKISASFSIEIKDYPSIGIPTYLGITAADRVDISVEFER